MATDKKAMAFDVDIGTGHQRGNPQDEKIRHHLEQEAREVRLFFYSALRCVSFCSVFGRFTFIAMCVAFGAAA